MKLTLTRRAVTKILLATPAVLAAGSVACQNGGSGPSSAPEHLTPEQKKVREELSKSVSRLRKSVERLGQMQIPVGSEPAIHFTPLLAKK